MVFASKADEWRSMDRWFIGDKAHAGIGKGGIKTNSKGVSKITGWFKMAISTINKPAPTSCLS